MSLLRAVFEEERTTVEGVGASIVEYEVHVCKRDALNMHVDSRMHLVDVAQGWDSVFVSIVVVS